MLKCHNKILNWFVNKVAEVSDDLADTEIEKFKSLTEDVDFNG